MSRLEYYNRPLVAFDPSRRDHRQYYAEFVKTGTWGRCPVRFIVPDETGGNLINLIQRTMLEYYVRKEFKVARHERN